MPTRGQILLALAILAPGLALLYWHVALKLVRDWAADENYSHGFLIVPIALYLAWERRRGLADAPCQPSAAGLAVIVASVAVLAAGTLGAELFLQRVSLLGVLAGAILFAFGRAPLRILAFPLAFLLLMIPIPAILFNQVAFPLQLLASRFGQATLLALGIPVLREGNIITLADVTLEVAEACSGIRSLVSLLTLAIVYGYFVESRSWARVALALAAIPVAIVANGLRVAGTGVTAHYWGASAAQGFLHTFSGWLVFLLAFVLLFAVQKVIARVGPHRGETPGRQNRQIAKSPTRKMTPRPRPVLRALIVTACFVLAAAGIARASRTEPTPPRESLEQFPMQIAGWQGESAERFDQQTLAVLGVDEYVSRIYSAPGAPPVGLYIGFYRSQRQGDTMHSPLNCLPGAGWEPVRTERVELPVAAWREAPAPAWRKAPALPAGAAPAAGNAPAWRKAPALRTITINRVLIQKGLDRQVVLYWYQSHGRVTASEYWGKIYTVLDAIRLNRTDAAMVRVISPVADAQSPASQAASERAASAFVDALFPLLNRFLPE